MRALPAGMSRVDGGLKRVSLRVLSGNWEDTVAVVLTESFGAVASALDALSQSQTPIHSRHTGCV